jgi:general secretion pathway protein H
VELLLVLVIGALLLTVVPPMFSAAIPGVQLKGAAREIAAALRYARGRAVANQETAAVILDVEARQYRVTGRERVRSLPKQLDLELFAARSEQTSGNAGGIRFFPDGSSTGGRITVKGGERAYKVDVDWLTGRVKILE